MIIRHKIWYIHVYNHMKIECYIFYSVIFRSCIVYRIHNLTAAQTRDQQPSPWQRPIQRVVLPLHGDRGIGTVQSLSSSRAVPSSRRRRTGGTERRAKLQPTSWPPLLRRGTCRYHAQEYAAEFAIADERRGVHWLRQHRCWGGGMERGQVCSLGFFASHAARQRLFG